MAGCTITDWSKAIEAHGWSIEIEISTLVTLARSGDAAVALWAIEAIHGIVREVLDPEVQQQLRRRLEIERRNRSLAGDPPAVGEHVANVAR